MNRFVTIAEYHKYHQILFLTMGGQKGHEAVSQDPAGNTVITLNENMKTHNHVKCVHCVFTSPLISLSKPYTGQFGENSKRTDVEVITISCP